MGVERLWTIRGAIALPASLPVGTAMARIETAILSQRPAIVEADGDQAIRWRHGFLEFVTRSNWELLGGVDNGMIWVDADRLGYAMRFPHVLMLCASAAIFAGLFMGSDSTAVEGVKWGLIALVWLIGANYLLTLAQIRRFFKGVTAAASSPPDGQGAIETE